MRTEGSRPSFKMRPTSRERVSLPVDGAIGVGVDFKKQQREHLIRRLRLARVLLRKGRAHGRAEFVQVERVAPCCCCCCCCLLIGRAIIREGAPCCCCWCCCCCYSRARIVRRNMHAVDRGAPSASTASKACFSSTSMLRLKSREWPQRLRMRGARHAQVHFAGGGGCALTQRLGAGGPGIGHHHGGQPGLVPIGECRHRRRHPSVRKRNC